MNVTSLEQSQWLKAHGAPQDTDKFWYHVPGGQNLVDSGHEGLPNPDSWYAAYDLESLIGWLIGDKRNSFYLQYDDEWSIYELEPQTEYKWHARYYPHTPVGFHDVPGATPLEAVWNLTRAIYGGRE